MLGLDAGIAARKALEGLSGPSRGGPSFGVAGEMAEAAPGRSLDECATGFWANFEGDGQSSTSTTDPTYPFFVVGGRSAVAYRCARTRGPFFLSFSFIFILVFPSHLCSLHDFRWPPSFRNLDPVEGRSPLWLGVYCARHECNWPYTPDPDPINHG